MKWLAFLFVGLTVPAVAQVDTDQPHRDWGQVATLNMTASEAAACIARGMQKKGPTLALPVAGGTDIDFTPGGFLGWGAPEAWMRFKVREEAGSVVARVFYKRPISQKLAGKYVAKLRKDCLKVASLRPSA